MLNILGSKHVEENGIQKNHRIFDGYFNSSTMKKYDKANGTRQILTRRYYIPSVKEDDVVRNKPLIGTREPVEKNVTIHIEFQRVK